MQSYQDFVIKDGKFIGKFEEMYKKFKNPWQQTSKESGEYSYSRNFTILNIKKFSINSIVEFGCGLGYFTNLIAKNTAIMIKGVDISQTAIEKAKKKFPHLDFVVDNAKNIFRYTDFDAILFAEITWYILDDLDRIFKLMLCYFKGKYFFHNLVFYKKQQKYGREFFTNLSDFINYVPFKLIAYAEASTVDSNSIETSTIFRI